MTKETPQTDWIDRQASGAAAIWLAALALIAAASVGAGADPRAIAGLSAVGAAPALALALARRARRRPIGRALLVFAWTACAVSACALAGRSGSGASAWFLAAPIIAGLLAGRGAAMEAGLLSAAGLAGGVIAAAIGAAPQDGAGWSLGPWGALAPLAPLALLGWAGLAQAARERKVLAGALRRTQTLDRLVAAAPDALLRVTCDARVVSAHGATERIFAAGGAELAGRSLASLVDEADRARLAAAIDQAAGRGVSVERLVRRDGEPFVVRLEPLGGGEALASLRASGVEEARLNALRTERDAALDSSAARARYIASLSHELRTPLNAVLGFSDVMRAKMFGPIAPRYAEYAGLIHESADHLLSLINGVLDYAKIEAGRYEIATERVDLRETVESAVRLTRGLAEAKSLSFALEPMRAALTVDADPKAVKQMLLNLISNAVKFTPERGRVSVRGRTRDGFVVLEVTDTGPGVAAGDLDKLGRPFEQTETGKRSAEAGTGLGLAIVRALAELHGGGLEVESEVGVGSTFRVRLPAADAAETEAIRLDARAQQARVRAALTLADAARASDGS